MIKILSLGAGVQSSTILLMSIKGELPRIDCAIFADTQFEPSAVYENLRFLRDEAARSGIPVIVATGGNIKDDSVRALVRGRKTDGHRWAAMPWTTANPDGTYGKIRRQCTKDYKLQVIDRFSRRQILNLKPRQRAPREPVIEKWIGISRDEAHRIKPAMEPYALNEYPLIGYPIDYGVSMSRIECKEWLNKNYPDRLFPRSACIGCPYRSDAEWREMRSRHPHDWNQAVEFDKAIRKAGGMRGETYTHRKCKPLDEAIGGDAPSLWGEECTGICGV